MALLVGTSVVAYAKPKKGVKTAQTEQTSNTVVYTNCTIENDGTVRNYKGEAIGKLSAGNKVVNANGEVIGVVGRQSLQSIGEVYFND